MKFYIRGSARSLIGLNFTAEKRANVSAGDEKKKRAHTFNYYATTPGRGVRGHGPPRQTTLGGANSNSAVHPIMVIDARHRLIFGRVVASGAYCCSASIPRAARTRTYNYA